jgi:elongation factor 1-gamma
VFKAQIAAAYVDQSIEVVPGFEMGVTNTSDAFLAKFPLGKVPAFETAAGEALTESDAIAYYVANAVKDSPLLGKTNFEKALVHKYVSFVASEIVPNLAKWLYPLNGWAKYNKETEQQAKEALKRALVALDAELLAKTFLVGERVTLADITVACHLLDAYKKLFDASYRADFPNVTRWFLTTVNQSKFKKVAGEVTLCAKMEVYDAKKFAAPKEEKPKKEKKEEKPKEDNLEDIAAAEAKEEAKKKNPLDELPPSPFVLDAWKRFYSNNDEKDSIKYFWENYDPKGFSLWKVDYKYNDELGQVCFMTSSTLLHLYLLGLSIV